MPTHQLGEHEIQLHPPPSMASRWEIFLLGPKNPWRAFGAALAACWKGPGRPAATLERSGWSVAAWGGAVVDELVARGIEPAQVNAVGAVAFGLLSEGLITEDQVQAAGNGSGAGAPLTG